MKHLSRQAFDWGLRLVLVAGVCLLAGSLVAKVHADTVVQGYTASTNNLEPGWVVALSGKGNSTVEPSPSTDLSKMFGVVVDPNSTSVTLNRQGQQVFVATAGTYPVLVSAENGPIVAGDYISMSVTPGIAAKASNTQEYVLGRALDSFNGKDNSITTSKSGSGVGRVNVSISVARSPLIKLETGVPEPLKHLGETLAGKPVPALRLYAGVAVFIATLVTAASLLYVGVRSSIVAIGRNPLSRKSVLRSMVQVLIVSAIVFIVGLFGVYLLLKL